MVFSYLKNKIKQALPVLGERLGQWGQKIIPINMPGLKIDGGVFGRTIGQRVADILPFRKGGCVQKGAFR